MMRQKIEMKKERIAIRVTTLPNGYSVNQLKDTIAELRKQVREQKKVIRELSKGV